MSTENENWRDAAPAEGNNASDRDGNQYNREGGYSRPSYNRENGDRPYRPRFNANGEGRPQRAYSSERPYRPRFNPNAEGGERPAYNNNGEGRPQRSYNNYGGSERPFRPRFNPNAEGGERPQRSYNSFDNNNNGEGRPQRSYNNYGGSERPFRPRFNPNAEGGERPYRPRFNPNAEGGERPAYNNNGEGRQQRSYNNYGGSERPFRPRFNNNGEGGERPYRPRFNQNGEGGERPFRPRFNQNGGGNRPYGNRPQGGQRRRTADYDPNAKYSKKKQIEYKEQFVDPNEPIRLNKFLANAGVCSRREADEFITAGVVSVNGVVVSELGTKIKRGDEVKFHEQVVSIERKIYVLLNKPKDTVTTSDDPQARRTVMDLVKGACEERIYPVGRLDRNTTGVLLLTNDGDLASKLTHPKYLKKKIYQVSLDKNLTKADMEQIAAGITLEDGEIHADAISYTNEEKKNIIGIEIHSGKNRIVRRIFESLGYKVMKLDRVFFAGLTKKGLRRGDWRYLTEPEVNFLRMGSFE